MRQGFLAVILAAAIMLVNSAASMAQASKTPVGSKAQSDTAGKTSTTTPDFSGVWAPSRKMGAFHWAFEAGEPIPMQPWAAQRCKDVGCGIGEDTRVLDENADPTLVSCAPYGVPRLLNS